MQHKLLCSHTTPVNICSHTVRYTSQSPDFVQQSVCPHSSAYFLMCIVIHWFAKSVFVPCVFIYLRDCFCVIQTACRQSRVFPVQTGSAVTVPSVETKLRGNTMEPPAATAVRASSDAPYARTMCTPAGTESRKCVTVWEREHRHKDETCMGVHFNMLLCASLIILNYWSQTFQPSFAFAYHIKLRYLRVHCFWGLLSKSTHVKCWFCSGSTGSVLWIKIRGTSVVSAGSTNASGLAWKKKVGKLLLPCGTTKTVDSPELLPSDPIRKIVMKLHRKQSETFFFLFFFGISYKHYLVFTVIVPIPDTKCRYKETGHPKITIWYYSSPKIRWRLFREVHRTFLVFRRKIALERFPKNVKRVGL